MQPTWLTSIRQTLLNCSGKINIQNEWIPPPQRQKDKYIMEEFAKRYRRPKLLKQLNRCRMSLKAITLSDITTSTGKQICPYALKGISHPHRHSTYTWPNQNEIAQKFWTIWRTCVKETFCHNKTRLNEPLKDWKAAAKQSQRWDTFADHDTGDLIWLTGEDDERQCKRHKRVPTSKFLVYNKGSGTATPIPATLYRISLWTQSPRTWIFKKSGSCPVTGAGTITTLSSPTVKTNLQIITRIQGPVRTQGLREHLAESLTEGKLMGASDGSVKNGMGSHAWILTPGNKNYMDATIKGSGPVDGHAAFMNSTRAERAGFIGPLLNTLHLAQEYSITTGTLHMHVDNTGSYRKGNAPKM